MPIYLHYPRFIRFGQLTYYILPLQEQVSRVWTLKVVRIEKQPWKRRTSARRYNIENFRWSIFDADVPDLDGHTDPLGCNGQEIAFLARRFVKCGPKLWPVGHQKRQNDYGEPGTASEHDKAFSPCGDEIGQLGAIQNVPSPHLSEGTARDEIVLPVPVF